MKRELLQLLKLQNVLVSCSYKFTPAYSPPHLRESKTVLDSGIPHRGFRIPSTGLRIPIVSGIPDSMSFIPDFKAQVSGFHKQKFPLLTRCPKQNFPDSGIRNPLHGAITVPQRALGKIGISSSVQNHSVCFYLVVL